MADTMSDDQKDIEIQKLKDQLWYMTTLNDNGRRFLADAQADCMKQLEEIGGLQTLLREGVAAAEKVETMTANECEGCLFCWADKVEEYFDRAEEAKEVKP
jgi:hypothetical protein